MVVVEPFDFFIVKGQIKPKADWRAIDSPKKGMDEFVYVFLP